MDSDLQLPYPYVELKLHWYRVDNVIIETLPYPYVELKQKGLKHTKHFSPLYLILMWN